MVLSADRLVVLLCWFSRERRIGHHQLWLQTLVRACIFCPESLLCMSGRADGAAPGEPSSQPKRAGRPPGKRCNYVTQDAEGRVIKRALSPFRARASASKRSSIADQQDSLIDPTRAAQVSAPLLEARSESVLNDVFQSPEGSADPASTDAAELNSASFRGS